MGTAQRPTSRIRPDALVPTLRIPCSGDFSSPVRNTCHWTYTSSITPIASPRTTLTMSTSVGVNVLRWSALGFGVFYGAYHQLSLSAADRAKAAQKDWEHKESLIRQAKQQWARDHPSE